MKILVVNGRDSPTPCHTMSFVVSYSFYIIGLTAGTCKMTVLVVKGRAARACLGPSLIREPTRPSSVVQNVRAPCVLSTLPEPWEDPKNRTSNSGL